MLKEKLQDIEESNQILTKHFFFLIEKFLCRVKFAPQSDGDWP